MYETKDDEPRCVTGCTCFTGGEVRHHKDCPYYPDSYSKMYDDAKRNLEAVTPVMDDMAAQLQVLLPIITHLEKHSMFTFDVEGMNQALTKYNKLKP